MQSLRLAGWGSRVVQHLVRRHFFARLSLVCIVLMVDASVHRSVAQGEMEKYHMEAEQQRQVVKLRPPPKFFPVFKCMSEQEEKELLDLYNHWLKAYSAYEAELKAFNAADASFSEAQAAFDSLSWWYATFISATDWNAAEAKLHSAESLLASAGEALKDGAAYDRQLQSEWDSWTARIADRKCDPPEDQEKSETPPKDNEKKKASLRLRPPVGGFYVSLDSNRWCAFGAGIVTAMTLRLLDDDSQADVSAAPSIGPDSDPVPPTSDKLPTPSRMTSARPGQTLDKPTPDRPVTDTPAQPTPITEVTPPASDDNPSEIPDNVEMKVKKQVSEEGQTGEPIEGQTIKLAQAEKPDLPVPVDSRKPASTRTAMIDRGFDKSTSQCVTDATGACTIPVSTDDRPYYHLPELAKGEHQNYRLEIARPLTSGGVAEILPGKERIDPKTLQSTGHAIISETFMIGNRVFRRFSLQTMYGADENLIPKLADAYGPSYEVDLCKEKYPEGAFDSANEHSSELPGATLMIRR